MLFKPNGGNHSTGRHFGDHLAQLHYWCKVWEMVLQSLPAIWFIYVYQFMYLTTHQPSVYLPKAAVLRSGRNLAEAGWQELRIQRNLSTTWFFYPISPPYSSLDKFSPLWIKGALFFFQHDRKNCVLNVFFCTKVTCKHALANFTNP